jgi:WD40 repeat protein
MSPVSRRHGIVVSGGEDSVIKVWELKGGCLIHTFHIHSTPVYCLYHCPPMEISLSQSSLGKNNLALFH